MDEELEKRKENISKKIKKTFFSWVTDNYDKIFLGVLVAAFIIRLVIFFKTSNQPLWWDEADYITAAKKWAGLNPALQDMWYYRRGFLFALVGTFFYKVGIGEIGLRFLEVLFSTGIVAVSYFLVRDMFNNKKWALLTSICLTFSWLVLFFTGRLLTDIPSAFFLLLSMWLFWKGYMQSKGNKFIYWFAAVYALAVLTRMQSFMFAPAFLIMIFVKEKLKCFKNKTLWIALGIFVLIFLPQVILYATHYGNPVSDILAHYFGIGVSTSGIITDTLEPYDYSILLNPFKSVHYLITGASDYISLLPNIIFYFFFLGLFYFLFYFVIGIDKIFKNQEVQAKAFAIFWVLSLFLILGYSATANYAPYIEERYFTAVLPFLFLPVAIFLTKIIEIISPKIKINKKVLWALAIILLVGLLWTNINFGMNMVEQRKTSYYEIQQAGNWIKQNSELNDTILSDSRPQTIYYAERNTYFFEDVNKTGGTFEEGLQKLKPRYMMLSLVQKSADWVYQYVQDNKEKVKPVFVYPYDSQPTLIVYELNYSSF